MNIVKTCKKHGGLTEEKVQRRSNRKEIICKQCHAERHKRYVASDPEKAKKRRLKFRYIERSQDIKELKCSRCASIKPVDKFNEHMLNMRYPYCLECRRSATRTYRQKEESKKKHREYYKTKYEHIAENNRLKKLYGIGLEDYEKMLGKQNHVCAICKKSEFYRTKQKGIYKFSVDHNHSTGSLRGLLCRSCNMAIGLFKESKETLMNAIQYLELYEK